MEHVWHELLADIAIIAIFISIWATANDWLHRVMSGRMKVIFGVLCGGTGMAVMTSPFEIMPGLFSDLRAVPIILAGLFSGPVGGIIAGGMTAAYRITFGGIGMYQGVAAIAINTCLGIALQCCRSNKFLGYRDVIDAGLLGAGGSLITVWMLPSGLQAKIFHDVTLPMSFLIFTGIVVSGSAILRENNRRATARTNEIYGSIVDALPDCLNAKDHQGRFLVANPATAAMMGATDESELIGRTDFDFYDRQTASMFRNEELEVFKRGQAMTLEQKVQIGDAPPIWLSTLKVPLASSMGHEIGIITHNRDITVQRRLERSLAATQAKLSDALTHMADGLVMFDGDGKLVYTSDRFKKMFRTDQHGVLTGMPLRVILEKIIDHFNIVLPEGLSNADWVEAELARIARLESSEMQLKDGRWIVNRHCAVRDGGWLTVFSDITAHKLNERSLIELNSKLEILARTDGLTGLKNRKTFDEALYLEFARSQRHGNNLGLMLIDVDRFEAFNDIYGHPEGDACLQDVADCLKRAARRLPDVVARYGGEEFAAIFPETDQTAMVMIAEQFRKSIQDMSRDHVGSEKGVVTVSIGVGVMEPGMDLRGPADFLRAADQALYRAKDAGRNCVRLAEIQNIYDNHVETDMLAS